MWGARVSSGATLFLHAGLGGFLGLSAGLGVSGPNGWKCRPGAVSPRRDPSSLWLVPAAALCGEGTSVRLRPVPSLPPRHSSATHVTGATCREVPSPGRRVARRGEWREVTGQGSGRGRRPGEGTEESSACPASPPCPRLWPATRREGPLPAAPHAPLPCAPRSRLWNALGPRAPGRPRMERAEPGRRPESPTGLAPPPQLCPSPPSQERGARRPLRAEAMRLRERSLRQDPDLRQELAALARGCDFVLPSRFKKRLKAFQQVGRRRPCQAPGGRWAGGTGVCARDGRPCPSLSVSLTLTQLLCPLPGAQLCGRSKALSPSPAAPVHADTRAWAPSYLSGRAAERHPGGARPFCPGDPGPACPGQVRPQRLCAHPAPRTLGWSGCLRTPGRGGGSGLLLDSLSARARGGEVCVGICASRTCSLLGLASLRKVWTP